MPELQWGHGDEAVEEKMSRPAAIGSTPLQWGHGDEAVEELIAMGYAANQLQSFNGATAMKPWKRTPTPRSTR